MWPLHAVPWSTQRGQEEFFSSVHKLVLRVRGKPVETITCNVRDIEEGSSDSFNPLYLFDKEL